MILLERWQYSAGEDWDLKTQHLELECIFLVILVSFQNQACICVGLIKKTGALISAKILSKDDWFPQHELALDMGTNDVQMSAQMSLAACKLG